MFHILLFSVNTEPYAIKRDYDIGLLVFYCSEMPRPAVEFDYSLEKFSQLKWRLICSLALNSLITSETPLSRKSLAPSFWLRSWCPPHLGWLQWAQARCVEKGSFFRCTSHSKEHIWSHSHHGNVTEKQVYLACCSHGVSLRAGCFCAVEAECMTLTG